MQQILFMAGTCAFSGLTLKNILYKVEGSMKIYWHDDSKNIVGGRIKRARQKLMLSQSNLAAKLQLEKITLDQKAISRIETGDRFVADYELLAFSKVLKVSVQWLLTESEK